MSQPIPTGRKSKPLIIGIAAVLVAAAVVGGLTIMKKSGAGGLGKPSSQADQADTRISGSQDNGAPVVTPPSTIKSGGLAETVHVPRDVSSLGEALAMCKENGIIELSDGSYAEAVVLTKSVSIISQGAVILEQSATGSSLITVKGPVKIVMKNIQIKDTRREADGDAGSSPPLVLASDGASLQFENCVIEGSSGNGISLADKASATFTGCRIRKNRGFGLAVTSGSEVNISLSEVRENGLSGISALHAGTKVTLGGGTVVAENGRDGIELGFGAELEATGAEVNGNRQLGIQVEGGESSARMEGGTVSRNRKFGALVTNQGKLVLSKVSVENNIEEGIVIENGGSAELNACRLVSNGKVGAYILGGSGSSLKVSDTLVSGHALAGIAVVGGKGEISGSTLSNNGTAVIFGDGATGRFTGNKVFPGPLADSIVLETDGEVIRNDNTLGGGDE
jgi:hypothetical protein